MMQKKFTAFISLKSSVSSLCLNEELFLPLRQKFPFITFEYFQSFKELEKRIQEADFVITWGFPRELFSRAKRLKVVFTPAAGNDWVAEDPSGKVAVCYGSFHGRIMSETLLGMILFFNNRFFKSLSNQAECKWNSNAQEPRTLLESQNVLIIGYGSIGSHCAKLLKNLGCNIAGLRRKFSGNYDADNNTRHVTMADINEELGKADHVVLLLPNSPSTKNMLTKEHLMCMKPTAFLYNLGRGNVIIEKDLIWALEEGIIAGAGLDVFEKEPLPKSSKLWRFPNVLITPHSSACYREYGSLFVEELAEKILPFIS